VHWQVACSQSPLGLAGRVKYIGVFRKEPVYFIRWHNGYCRRQFRDHIREAESHEVEGYNDWSPLASLNPPSYIPSEGDTMKPKTPEMTPAEVYQHSLQCPENHLIGVAGRPQLPDFKERVKGGADPATVMAEAVEYHTKRGTLVEFKRSATFRWIAARVK